MTQNQSVRSLLPIFGDQLSTDTAAFKIFDPAHGVVVWIAEPDHQASHVWSHKQRLTLIFSAMRHLRDKLQNRKRYFIMN